MGTFVTTIAPVLNTDLGKFAEEFGNKTHQKIHQQILKLSRDMLYHIKHDIR